VHTEEGAAPSPSLQAQVSWAVAEQAGSEEAAEPVATHALRRLHAMEEEAGSDLLPPSCPAHRASIAWVGEKPAADVASIAKAR
jgi:hypothetical protein